MVLIATLAFYESLFLPQDNKKGGTATISQLLQFCENNVWIVRFWRTKVINKSRK